MKNLKYLLSILTIFFSISLSYSQSADDIINKYIDAVGGMDKINSIQTVKITAKTYGMGMDIPVIMTIKKPDEIRLDITVQGQTMVQACDGEIGWMINPFQGSKDAEKMNEEQTKGMKEQAQFEGQLVNYKEKGSTAEFLGKEDMEGTDVYKILLTKKDSSISTFYLDAKSYLILKETGKRKIKEKEINSTTILGDYKSEDGYMMPHSMEIKSDGGGMDSQKITIDKVEFNTSVDETIFKMPESK
ncbi:MAG: hypothetical protein ACHQJ4_01960 [Ignavibacteria bacterium]